MTQIGATTSTVAATTQLRQKQKPMGTLKRMATINLVASSKPPSSCKAILACLDGMAVQTALYIVFVVIFQYFTNSIRIAEEFKL